MDLPKEILRIIEIVRIHTQEPPECDRCEELDILHKMGSNYIIDRDGDDL